MDAGGSRALPVIPLGAAAVAAAVLAIYIRTLSPTVAGGDSGELITAAYTLGVVHPPGYPLYTLLAKIFTLLPVGSVAWRVNLFSAVCGAGAAAFLFLAVARWSKSPWAGLAAASLFAFSPGVWPHAVTAEVFALNNLFDAGLVYLTVRFWEDRGVRLACVIFLWSGLGLANHLTLIFFAVPACLFVVIQGGVEMRRPRRLLLFALCAVAGLLPYAYLPFASARLPLTSWGDETTLAGFLTHVLRLEYGTFQLGASGSGVDANGSIMDRLWVYGSSAFADLAWVGPVLAAAGVASSWRLRSRPLTWVWITACAVSIVVINGLTNIPVDAGISRFIEGRFWQQPDMVICVFAGLGLASIASAAGSADRIVLPIAAVVLSLAQPAIYFHEEDKSHDTQIRDNATAILDSLPAGSLLLEQGDQVFNGLRYVQVVEGYRTDVRVMDEMLLGYPWYGRLVHKYDPGVTLPGSRLLPSPDRAGDYGLKALLDANHAHFPIYLCDVPLWSDAQDTYSSWPSGLVDLVLPTPDEPALPSWMAAAASSFNRVDTAALGRYPEDSWERLSLLYFWKQVGMHALSLARWAAQHDDDRTALLRSAELMENLMARSPEAPPQLRVKLGAVYLELAKYDPAFKVRARDEMKTFLRETPRTDPEVPQVEELLQATQ